VVNALQAHPITKTPKNATIFVRPMKFLMELHAFVF
jgi:hypothetical protein